MAPERWPLLKRSEWSLWFPPGENSKVKALRWSRFDRNNGGLSQKGRKHRGEWKKGGSEKLQRFLKDFLGHDKDFGPWEATDRF